MTMHLTAFRLLKEVEDGSGTTLSEKSKKCAWIERSAINYWRTISKNDELSRHFQRAIWVMI